MRCGNLPEPSVLEYQLDFSISIAPLYLEITGKTQKGDRPNEGKAIAISTLKHYKRVVHLWYSRLYQFIESQLNAVVRSLIKRRPRRILDRDSDLGCRTATISIQYLILKYI